MEKNNTEKPAWGIFKTGLIFIGTLFIPVIGVVFGILGIRTKNNRIRSGALLISSALLIWFWVAVIDDINNNPDNQITHQEEYVVPAQNTVPVSSGDIKNQIASNGSAEGLSVVDVKNHYGIDDSQLILGLSQKFSLSGV